MWYSVHKGKIPGVYKTWTECQSQVSGFKGARFKKFESKKDAIYFYQNGTEYVEKVSSLDGIIYVYTDGSCVRKNGDIQTGMGIYWGVHSDRNYGENISDRASTNNQAELMAIEHALYQISQQQLSSSLVIFTDSKYSIQAIENSPKKMHMSVYPNKVRIDKIYNQLSNLPNVSLRHIFAHSNRSDQHSVGNREADRLAYSAATHT